MFCPTCKTEYRPGFSRCADCGVNLVPALEKEAAEEAVPLELPPIKGDAWELLYEGPNEAECKVAAAALSRAEIPFNLKRSAGPPVILAQGAPIYSLWVSPSDLVAAQVVLAEAVGPQPTEEELDQLELPAGTGQPVKDSSPEDIPDDWDPATANTEVWTGSDAGMPQALQDCLRENGIPSRCLGESNEARRVLVRAVDEMRAREILREIIEATPPE